MVGKGANEAMGMIRIVWENRPSCVSWTKCAERRVRGRKGRLTQSAPNGLFSPYPDI